MKTTFIAFLILLVAESVYASGICSCSGTAVVRNRSDVKNYSSMVRFDRSYPAEASDPKRNDFERVVQVLKDDLECSGHSVCTYPEILYFLQIKKSKAPPIQGQILTTMYSNDTDLSKVLLPGVEFNFSHRAITSRSGNGSTWNFEGIVNGKKAMTEKKCIEDLGGVWGRFGEWPEERCNLRSSDEGKICDSSSDCRLEDCIAEITKEEEEQLTNGEALFKSGKCSEFELNFGCHPFVKNGKIEGILCQD